MLGLSSLLHHLVLIKSSLIKYSLVALEWKILNWNPAKLQCNHIYKVKGLRICDMSFWEKSLIFPREIVLGQVCHIAISKAVLSCCTVLFCFVFVSV